MATTQSNFMRATVSDTGSFKLRIKHTRIAQVMEELDTLIYPGSAGNIFLICGPTGAGKTTLARHLVQSRLEASHLQMQEDAGVIPAIYIEAQSCGDVDGFDWRFFYQEILGHTSAGMPLPHHAFGIDEATDRFIRPTGRSENSVTSLRRAVENGLKQRGVGLIVIDEAAHIFQQTPRHKLGKDLNTLKSLVNKSGAQIVLIGSYDLFDLMSLSGQIARRTHVIHFERYREDTPADIRAFRGCIQKFEDARPALLKDRLMPYAEILHENTLGCVGTLHDVLARLSSLAAKAGAVTDDLLRRALLTEAQRDAILAEILEGEDAIKPGLTRALELEPKKKRAQSARIGA